MSVAIETVANVPIRLKEPFDLSFMHRYGAVFTVVDNYYGSGNLCFGVENEGRKYFIKFAGAPKEKFDLGKTEDAIGWLKEAQQVYQDLRHQSLIECIGGEEIGGGYAAIFAWTDAECIGASYPASRQKFLNLPIATKLRVFDDILNFHAHVAERGYVAIDFYADQILYDFESGQTTLCDIDFYQQSPYYGDKGPWVSANFVSPEECIPGERIDEVTMVYTMGATAFSIFADHDRSREKWPLSESLFQVAAKAVSDERTLRQQTIRQLMQEWAENIAK